MENKKQVQWHIIKKINLSRLDGTMFFGDLKRFYPLKDFAM